jgi:rhamnosyltransferase subunit B
MARIVLATFGSLGDLHPVLALAHELRQRGHAATIATSELYREKIFTLGFGFAALRPEISILNEALVRRIMDGPRGTEVLLRELVLPEVHAMHTDLAHATAGADLLVTSELVYAAPLLAEQTGLRWASYALAPLSYFSIHDPCVPPVALGGEWLHTLPPFAVRQLNRLAALLTHAWWRPVREFRRELGLPPGGNPLFAGKHSPRLDLALFSSVLQPPQADWPASTVQCGFCFYDEAAAHATLPPVVEKFLAAGESPIVFTLGSAAVFAAENFYLESVRAAQQLGRRALLLLGNNPLPPGLPPTILAWDYLPFAQIFPRAAAIVHQGGVGTTAQALRAGRPMLVMPFGFDQPDNAARVTRLGVGRTLPRSRYTADRAARELAALLAAPGVSVAASILAARIRTEHGPATACDALEAQLR